MPTCSVECTNASSVTVNPESNSCTYSADPFLDISRVLMSVRFERLTARILSRNCSSCLSWSMFGSIRSVPPLPEGWNHLVINLSNNLGTHIMMVPTFKYCMSVVKQAGGRS
jgi:hypothetical protein